MTHTKKHNNPYERHIKRGQHIGIVVFVSAAKVKSFCEQAKCPPTFSSKKIVVRCIIHEIELSLHRAYSTILLSHLRITTSKEREHTENKRRACTHILRRRFYGLFRFVVNL